MTSNYLPKGDSHTQKIIITVKIVETGANIAVRQNFGGLGVENYL